MNMYILLFAFISSAFANSCPDLSGAFECPAVPQVNQPASTFMVVQKTEGDITIYKSLWSDFSFWEDRASDAGEETEDGFLISCKDNKRYFKKIGSSGEGTASFINEAGNHEAWHNGVKVVECLRLKP